MRVAVLGAGVVGVTTAWYLAEAGHDVTVIDRQPAPALETSFANGGQISVSHAEPWANPSAPLKILRWLGREDAPLLWRWRADASQWSWGLRFLRECTAGRTRANITAILRIALYSRAALRTLRDSTGIEYDHLERGILHLYFDRREFERAIPQALLMSGLGCDRVAKTVDQCIAVEPALADSEIKLVGGIFASGDESGDACKFTQELADRCERRGVIFRYGTSVAKLLPEGGRIAAVRALDGAILEFDAYVTALGSYTPLLLRPLGMRMPMVPAKGYSATIPLMPQSVAPTVSLIDDQRKLVFSRLGNRLRVAGTAEFNGYDTSLNSVRCEALLDRCLKIFPRIGRPPGIDFWAGLRPATPGNLPMVGGTCFPNLFVNTGHGTLGWTMSCGSARLVADLVSGREPEISAAPYAPF